jgi:hypothetical protein
LGVGITIPIENRLVGLGEDAVGVPYNELPELIVHFSGQRAQSMANEFLNDKAIEVTSEFTHLSALLSDPVRGALALFPLSFAYQFLYAWQCLELTDVEQQALYRGCETAIRSSISVSNHDALAMVCRDVYRGVLRWTHAERINSSSDKVHFGFTNDVVRYTYQVAVGTVEVDALEASVAASPVVAALNHAANWVGLLYVGYFFDGNCKYCWR